MSSQMRKLTLCRTGCIYRSWKKQMSLMNSWSKTKVLTLISSLSGSNVFCIGPFQLVYCLEECLLTSSDIFQTGSYTSHEEKFRLFGVKEEFQRTRKVEAQRYPGLRLRAPDFVSDIRILAIFPVQRRFLSRERGKWTAARRV
jgi:hypothetical protein